MSDVLRWLWIASIISFSEIKKAEWAYFISSLTAVFIIKSSKRIQFMEKFLLFHSFGKDTWWSFSFSTISMIWSIYFVILLFLQRVHPRNGFFLPFRERTANLMLLHYHYQIKLTKIIWSIYELKIIIYWMILDR